MKLVFSYVALTPGVGIPADRFLHSAMRLLKDRVERITCKGVERIRVQLIVDVGVQESCAIEEDIQERIAHCFVDAEKYRSLRSPERAELLAAVAEGAVSRIVSTLDCTEV